MPGFKAAVLTKLGGTWIHGSKDFDTETVMFTLPENSKLKEFKSSIGREIITAFELRFLADVEEALESESPAGRTPNGAVKMTIWTNNDSKVTGKKS